jgi:hypothetical protein
MKQNIFSCQIYLINYKWETLKRFNKTRSLKDNNGGNIKIFQRKIYIFIFYIIESINS